MDWSIFLTDPYNRAYVNSRFTELTCAMSRTSGPTRQKVAQLQQDVGTLTLVLLTLIIELSKRGAVDWRSLRTRLKKLDGIDGREDSRISLDTLAVALGMPRGTHRRSAPIIPPRATRPLAVAKRLLSTRPLKRPDDILRFRPAKLSKKL